MVDAKIPEGIPTGVAPTVAVPTPSQSQSTSPQSPQSVARAGEGLLDKAVKSLAKFFAKLGGLPDPITGQPTSTSTSNVPLQKAASFADKVWSAANKVADTATTVATQTMETTKTTVNKAVEGVKEVQSDISSASSPATPEVTVTQSLDTLDKTS